jgi:hypothetical protein
LLVVLFKDEKCKKVRLQIRTHLRQVVSSKRAQHLGPNLEAVGRQLLPANDQSLDERLLNSLNPDARIERNTVLPQTATAPSRRFINQGSQAQMYKR